MMLTNEQSNKIKELRRQIKEIYKGSVLGWMCEGTDDNCLFCFNNELEASFLINYKGVVVSPVHPDSVVITDEILQWARLEAQIANICYGEKSESLSRE